MEPLAGEVGTWPDAYWYLEYESGVPDHNVHRAGRTLILFSSIERATRFHDEFPAARIPCTPRSVEVGGVLALVKRHFPNQGMRWYLLDPEPEDFDAAGRYAEPLYSWPLNLKGLCGWIGPCR